MTQTTTMKAAAPNTGRVRMLMFGMLMAVLATVAVSSWAQSASAPAGEQRMHRGMQGHEMHHGMGGGMGGGMMMGGSPEHMGRMIDHMLDGLNATDAQRSQIKQIAQAAAADLKTQREAARGLHERGMQAFTAPTIDANAVESVRQQMLAQHDQMSRRMSQAMLDIGRVLTPEQRAKIGERMKQRAAQMQERMERMQKEHPPR